MNEILISILLVAAIWGYFKWQEYQADTHCNDFEIDWGKVSDDRIYNALSNSQINKNIISGKYDKRRY